MKPSPRARRSRSSTGATGRPWPALGTLVSSALVLTLALCQVGAIPAAAARSIAGSPVLHTIALGYAPPGLIEDSAIGHALVFNTHDPSAETIDIKSGAVLANVPLGSAFDYVFADVDPRSHHFFLSLPRGHYSKGGGNQVFMLDARTGAVLRALPGTDVPSEVAVDAAHSHVFVADTGLSAVLMYDSRTGALLRKVPSCHATDELALSERTEHLFVRCTDGTLVMHDARSGVILHQEPAHLSTAINNFDIESGIDTGLSVNEQAHRLLVFDLTASTSSLYDTATGRLVRVLQLHGDFTAEYAQGSFYFVGIGHQHLLGVPLQQQHARPGQFYVLSGTTGSIQREYRVPGVNPSPIGENPLTGHLLVLVAASSNLPGTLFVLDTHSGNVLRSVTLGAQPSGASIDTHAGVLLVVNEGWSQPGTLSILDLRQL